MASQWGLQWKTSKAVFLWIADARRFLKWGSLFFGLPPNKHTDIKITHMKHFFPHIQRLTNTSSFQQSNRHKSYLISQTINPTSWSEWVIKWHNHLNPHSINVPISIDNLHHLPLHLIVYLHYLFFPRSLYPQHFTLWETCPLPVQDRSCSGCGPDLACMWARLSVDQIRDNVSNGRCYAIHRVTWAAMTEQLTWSECHCPFSSRPGRPICNALSIISSVRSMEVQCDEHAWAWLALTRAERGPWSTFN